MDRALDRAIDREGVERIVRQVIFEYLGQEKAGAGTDTPTASSSAAMAGTAPGRAANARLYTTLEAEAIKKEICSVGRKLWLRQFVDGNGGNISFRIGPNEILCTPTMVSKYDLTPKDICLTDLEGKQIAGPKPRTSELLLHLEIYKAVPGAKAVVHCHPPHATAYAITGRVPPNLVIPEFEILVGKVAIAPYETPGTQAFAETVVPYVQQHNTVLLSNHGIVCWADTVTHAEWSVEVLETYCWTLMLANQLGAPISRISDEQASDLLAVKKKLGLPDDRFDTSLEPAPRDLSPGNGSGSGAELNTLVKSLTDAVMKALAAR